MKYQSKKKRNAKAFLLGCREIFPPSDEGGVKRFTFDRGREGMLYQGLFNSPLVSPCLPLPIPWEAIRTFALF